MLLHYRVLEIVAASQHKCDMQELIAPFKYTEWLCQVNRMSLDEFD